MPTGYTSQDCWGLCPWPHSRPLSTHASARDSQTFTGKSALVSCGVTAPFTWILVCTKFYLFSSVAQSCSTLCNPQACHASLSITTSQRLLKLMSIGSVMLSNQLILCRTLLRSSIFHSIRVFSNESVLHIRWPKYWSFSFSISPSNEYSGLISFRMDCLDLLEVQETFKSLLQHPNSKVSILRCSTFFIVHTWLLEKP